MHHRKKILPLWLLLLSVVLLSSCASSFDHMPAKTGSSQSDAVTENNAAPTDAQNTKAAMRNSVVEDKSVEGFGATPASQQTGSAAMGKPALDKANAKVIVSGSIEMETLHYEDTIKKVQQYIVERKGTIASSDVQGVSLAPRPKTSDARMAVISVRIPKGEYESFLEGLKSFGQITGMKLGTQDISGHYFDTETRVTSLKVQEQRLLELFNKADKISDIIVIEDKLRDVRQQIEALTGQLNVWDNQVDDASFRLSIQEVRHYQERTEAGEAFGSSLLSTIKQSLLHMKVFLEALLLIGVYLLPYLGMGWLAYVGLRFFRKKLRAIREKRISSGSAALRQKDLAQTKNLLKREAQEQHEQQEEKN